MRVSNLHSQKRRLLQSNVAEAYEGFQKSWCRNEMLTLLASLDIRKAKGLDGMSGWTLRECKDQLIQPICEVINSSIEERRVPKKW